MANLGWLWSSETCLALQAVLLQPSKLDNYKKMFELTVEADFSAAHRLKTVNKKCERLHGHNWKVQLFLSGKKVDKTGILLDFKEAKSRLKEVITPLDHTYLNEIPFFKRISPTSENIAFYLYQKLKGLFAKNKGIKVAKVTVWESETTAASYFGEKNE